MPNSPPVKGMPHMLNLCGLELEGKHHSGIDDSKNIARVVLKCIEKGYKFHQGMVLSFPFKSGPGLDKMTAGS